MNAVKETVVADAENFRCLELAKVAPIVIKIVSFAAADASKTKNSAVDGADVPPVSSIAILKDAVDAP